MTESERQKIKTVHGLMMCRDFLQPPVKRAVAVLEESARRVKELEMEAIKKEILDQASKENPETPAV